MRHTSFFLFLLIVLVVLYSIVSPVSCADISDYVYTSWVGGVHSVNGPNPNAANSIDSGSTSGTSIAGLDVFPDGRIVATVSVPTSGPQRIEIYNSDFSSNKSISFSSGELGSVVDCAIFNFQGQHTLYPQLTEAVLCATRSTTYGIIIVDIHATSNHYIGKYQESSDGYEGVVVIPNRAEVWASRQVTTTIGAIHVFDLYTGIYKHSIDLDNGQTRAGSMYYSPSTDTVLITSIIEYATWERNADLTGSYVRTFPRYSTYTGPYGVTRRPDTNEVYVTYIDNSAIVRYSPTGGEGIESQITNAANPVGIKFINQDQDTSPTDGYADDQLVIGHWNEGEIYVYTVDTGVSTVVLEGLMDVAGSQLACVEVLPNGNMFMTSSVSSYVHIYSPDGILVDQYSITQLGSGFGATGASYVNYHGFWLTGFTVSDAVLVAPRSNVDEMGIIVIDLNLKSVIASYARPGLDPIRAYTGVQVIENAGAVYASAYVNGDPVAEIDIFELRSRNYVRTVSIGDHSQMMAGSIYYSPSTDSILMADHQTNAGYERKVDENLTHLTTYPQFNSSANNWDIVRHPTTNKVLMTHHATDTLTIYNTDGSFSSVHTVPNGPLNLRFANQLQDQLPFAGTSADRLLVASWWTGEIYTFSQDNVVRDSVLGRLADKNYFTGAMELLPTGHMFFVSTGDKEMYLYDDAGQQVASAALPEITYALNAVHVSFSHTLNNGTDTFDSAILVTTAESGSTAGVRIVAVWPDKDHMQLMSFKYVENDAAYSGVTAIVSIGQVWAGVYDETSTVHVFDWRTTTFKHTITLDNGQKQATSMYYSPSTNTVFMADSTTHKVYERNVDTTGSLVRTFSPSNGELGAHSVARRPDNGMIYASFYSSDAIVAFNADGTVASSVTTGGVHDRPIDVLHTNQYDDKPSVTPYASGNFLVAHWVNGFVYTYDSNNNNQQAGFFADVGGLVGATEFLPNGNVVFTSSATSEIKIYDSTGSIVRSAVIDELASIEGTTAFSSSTDGSYVNYNGQLSSFSSVTEAIVFSSRNPSLGASIIDLTTLEYVGNYVNPDRVSAEQRCEGLVIIDTPAVHEVWVGIHRVAEIDVFDLYTRQLLRTVDISDNNQGCATSMYYSPSTNTVLMGDRVSNNGYERDVDSAATHVRTFAVQNNNQFPYGITRRPDNSQVYMTYYANNTLSVFEADGTPVDDYPLSQQPLTIAFVDYIDDAPVMQNCANNITDVPAPTFTATTSATDYIMTVTFQQDRRFDAGFGYGYDDVTVVFDTTAGPSGTPCDFNTTDIAFGETSIGNWQLISINGSQCLETWQMSLSTATVLGQCGFRQDEDREPGRVHFLNTIDINTRQIRVDLERIDYNKTQSFEFSSDVSIANNATATTGNITVYGEAFTLDVLGNLRISVIYESDSSFTYQVTGQAVTDVQYPYRLELASDEVHEHFNQTTGVTAVPDTYCDNNAKLELCRQVWTFTTFVDSSVACTSVQALTDEWISMTFSVNCSDQFDGECAPSFAQTPQLNFTLVTADFCPETDTLSLDTVAKVYAYDAVEAPVANAWSQGSEQVPEGFSEEAIFVYESTLFGQVQVLVVNDAATLATSTISEIRTVPDDLYATIVVYRDDDLNGTPEIVADSSSVVVANSGFGPDSWSDSHVRFQFQLNADTFDRDNVENESADARQLGSIEIDIVSTFAQGSEQQNVADVSLSLSHSGLLSAFEQHNRMKEIKQTISLSAANGADTQSMRTAVRIRVDSQNVGPGTPGPASGASSSSAFVVSPISAFAIVGGIVIVVLAAVMYKRRSNNTQSGNKDHSNNNNYNNGPPRVVASTSQLQMIPMQQTSHAHGIALPMSSSFVGGHGATSTGVPESLIQLQPMQFEGGPSSSAMMMMTGTTSSTTNDLFSVQQMYLDQNNVMTQ
jgi:DNA-binding beta-propeller fold protein YncE